MVFLGKRASHTIKEREETTDYTDDTDEKKSTLQVPIRAIRGSWFSSVSEWFSSARY
jgi:hypothetical protein